MSDGGISVATAQERLQLYLAAETKVLSSQAYKMGDREMTRADLKEIREGIKFWQGQVAALDGSSNRPRGRIRGGSYRNR